MRGFHARMALPCRMSDTARGNTQRAEKVGARVTGIDLSQKMLARAATVAKKYRATGTTFLMDDFHLCELRYGTKASTAYLRI